MTIDRTAVKKIARLARIAIEDDQIPQIEERLNNILTWIECLNEVDTQHVEPLFSVLKDEMPRRQDLINDGNQVDQILQNAPEQSFNMFAVPKVVE